jgi:predicted TIM-barrel fold metal-dependent hydrolase
MPREDDSAPDIAATRLVSSDTHVVEPPQLWLERLPAAWRDRAPRTVLDDDDEWWFVDGLRTNSFAGGAQAGLRFEDPASLRVAARFEDVRRGAYDPAEHLAENEEDGVLGSVLYPTEGLLLYAVPDSELLTVTCAAYNNWLIDFCSYDFGRLRGIAMLNTDDATVAAAELERCADAGLAGALVPVSLAPGDFYDDPRFDVLWAAASDLDMPLSLHIGTSRASATGGGFAADLRSVRASTMVNQDHQVRNSLTDLILGGVFERFGRLRVGSVEHELGWAPYFIDTLDLTYTQRARRKEWHRFEDASVLPSDFFRRNVFMSFQSDAIGIELRRYFGDRSLMWGSDYPHTESTFPRSRQVLTELLGQIPADERADLVCNNAVSLYGFGPAPDLSAA